MTTSSQITSSYQRILFRDPSVAELNNWVSAVNGGSVALSDVRASLIASTEASSFVDPVIRLYQAAFGRVPESGGALDYYADRLRDGRMSVFNMAEGFAASPEFAGRYGAGGPSAAFITALYLNVLDRVPAGAEVDWYLASGMTAAQMLLGFAQSPEFQQKSASAVDAFLDSNAQGTAVFTGPLQILSTDPTYELSVSTNPLAVDSVDSANEGQTLYFTLATENVAAGTSLSYIITGVNSADLGGAPLSGTVVVDASGFAVLTVSLAADAVTEGRETLNLAIVTPDGAVVSSVGVNDTSLTPVPPTPTFNLTRSSPSVAEGGAVQFTLQTQNVAPGATYEWSLSGTGISAADVVGGQLSGTAIIDSQGRAIIPVTLTADAQTEGAESLTLSVAGQSATVTVNDTSLTPVTPVPPTPTFELTRNSPTVAEGGTVQFTLQTQNVAQGATYQWSLSGAGISAADVVGGQLSGTATIDSQGRAIIPVTLTADAQTEGAESLTLSVAGQSATVTVNDTSLAPPATYGVVPSGSSVDEGGSLTYTIATSNVADGTELQYEITGALAADFSRGNPTGTVVVTGGVATVSLTLASDNLTEGAETLVFALKRGGSVVATAPTVVVYDTSVGNFTVTARTITAANAAGEAVAVVTSQSADPVINVQILSDVNTATHLLGGFIIQGTGNHSITSGDSGDLITMNGTGADSISSGNGNDTTRFQSANFTSADAVTGGNGNDTLEIVDTATVVDADFTNVRTMESLLLSGAGAQNVTLGSFFNGTGIRTVTATAGTASSIDIGGTSVGLTVTTNAGNDTVTAGSGADTISTGEGNDTIRFLSANFTSADVVSAGNGTDTIQITDNATVEDADFTNVTSVETLLLSGTGAQSVTLASAAQTAGIRTVDATAATGTATIDISGTGGGPTGLTVSTGSGNDLVTSGAGNDTISTGNGMDTVIAGNGADTISTGEGNDTVRFLSTAFTSADTVAGGNGTDTIEITDNATVVDAGFTNVTSVETLLLSGTGAQSATLATAAQTAGIRTVTATAATGNSTIDISGTSAGLTVSTGTGNDLVTSGAGSDVISTGNGSDMVIAGNGNDNISTGNQNDMIRFLSASFDGADTVSGDSGTDTIEITDNATVLNADFTNVTSVETLLLSGTGAQLAVLASAAQTAGIRTVTATAGTASDINILDTSAGLTVTTNAGNDAVWAGSGADNISTGVADDTIRFRSADFTSSDIVAGGNGADTIEIIDRATVEDSDFTNVSSVETLLLSGGLAQNATLASASHTAGIRTVTATVGTASTIDISGTWAGLTVTTNAGNDTVIAGSGADNISTGEGADTIRFLSTNFTSADIVAGGHGNDTIQITDTATVVDADFTNVSSVETLRLSGTGAQSATLATAAQTAGIRTVDAMAGTASTINISGTWAGLTVTTNAGDDTVMAGNGADNISTGTDNDSIAFLSAGFQNTDTVSGGEGIDTILITDQATVVDADFTNVTSVENLLLIGSDAQNVTLAALSDTAGIRRVETTAGFASTIDISGTSAGLTVLTNWGSDTVTAGAGANNISTGDASDTIGFVSANFTSADTVDGGSDNDTIEITNNATVVDADFTNVTSVETLLLSGINSNTVTLGGLSDAAGIRTVTAMAGSAYIDIGGTSANLTVTTNGASDAVIAGAGANNISTGSNADTISFLSANFDNADTVDGGASNSDMIQITDQATVEDADFTNVTSVETLFLTGAGAQNVTLAGLSDAAGITMVHAMAGTASTIDISGTSAGLRVYTNAGADMVNAGAGEDNISTGDANDTISFLSGTFTSDDSVNGGDGLDTIQITDNAVVPDSDFTNVTSVERLVLSGTGVQNVTLAGRSDAAGIRTVDATAATGAATINISGTLEGLTVRTGTGNDLVTSGAGSDTISTGNGADTVIAGSGDDAISTGNQDDTVRFLSANFDAGDTVDGGAGGGIGDTIEITDNTAPPPPPSGPWSLESVQSPPTETAVVDADFTNVTSVERLLLSGTGDQQVTLAERSDAAGIRIVTAAAATGNAYIDIHGTAADVRVTTGSGYDAVIAGSGWNTISTWEGNDTIQFLSNNFDAFDFVSGGDDDDMIQITDQATVVDADFMHVTSVETLWVSGVGAQNNVTLAEFSDRAGIRFVEAFQGTASTIDIGGTSEDVQVVTNTGNDTVIAGSGYNHIDTRGGDDTIRFVSGNFDSHDTVYGGDDNDTIEITDNNADVYPLDFGHVSSVETLLLSGAGAHEVTLDLTAQGAGIRTVTATEGTASTIDISAMSANMTVTTNAGADTVIAGNGNDNISTGNDDDTIQFLSANFTSADTVDGGDNSGGHIGPTVSIPNGVDTIEITDTATVVDANFTHVTSVETLLLSDTGHQTVTLAALSDAAGIRTVNATAGTASTIDISGTSAGLTVITNAGGDLVTAGEGNGADNISTGDDSDTIRFVSASLTDADIVDGGNDADTIEITDTATVVDADFTNVTSVETLLLSGTGAQSVTLANLSDAAGIRSVYAYNGTASTIDIGETSEDVQVYTDAGADTVTAGSGSNIIGTGEGDDTIRFESGNFEYNYPTTYDVVYGGNGNDTIEITDNNATVVDSDFTAVYSVETLLLSGAGAHDVTLGMFAQSTDIRTVDASAGTASTIDISAMSADMTVTTNAGADTVIAGNGADTISTGDGNDLVTAGSGADNISTGNDDDTIQFLSGDFQSDDTVAGGNGNDTIEITDQASVADADFTNVTSVETLLLSDTGAQFVTLGGLSDTAGIRTVDASAGNGSAINISGTSAGLAVTTNVGQDTVVAGSGADNISTGEADDTIQFLSANFVAADTVAGGNDNDTIEITDTATVVDADFTNVTSVETLLLSDTGHQTVTLAALSDAAGILTVDATAGTASTIDISGTSAGLTVSTNAGSDTVTAGSGADNISTGNSGDTIRFVAANFTSADTVHGGNDNDTIDIADDATGANAVVDADFTNVTSVAELLLSGTGAQTVTLAGASDSAGIIRVEASVGMASTIDVGGTSGDVMVITDAGNDTVIAGSGRNGISTGSDDDTIQFRSAMFDQFDGVDGGNGDDTIEITDNATVVNADFANKTSVETLLLSGTGAQSVTLANLSDAAGIRTVTATAGTASTINISGTSAGLTVSTNAGNDTVIAGAGDDNISTGNANDEIRFASANFTSADTVAGGNGTDTIYISDAATVEDADFTNVTSVERLRVANATNSVTLGDLAAVAGIATVIGSAGDDTLVLTDDQAVAGSITAVRFDSTGGNDTLNIGGLTVTVTLALDGAGDTIIATDGANIVGINAGAATTAEDLTLTGGITMTLDQHEGLTTITAGGSSDSVTLTTSGAFTGEAAVETYFLANAAGNVFTQVAGNTSVVGGSGADRIITSGTDAARGAVTIDLTEGGLDTLQLRNDAVGNTNNNVLNGFAAPQAQRGLGGAWVEQDGGSSPFTGESNAATLNQTIALWDGTGGTDFATITGFSAGNGGDRVAYMNGSSLVLIGGFSDNVSLTTNNLSGLAVNSVIEVASSFQINDGENLGAAATMLWQLNNVQDGTYYVVIYDGTSADSNAWIYAATATEGDGFDFADDNGSTNGYDVDTVELLGVIMGVGADNLTSQNFISSSSFV